MPLNRTATVGDHFELQCDITSSPQPEIVWKRDDKIIAIIDFTFAELDDNNVTTKTVNHQMLAQPLILSTL